MGEWADLIWFVVWAAVILAGAALLIWLIVASVAAAGFRKMAKDFDNGPQFKSTFRRR